MAGLVACLWLWMASLVAYLWLVLGPFCGHSTHHVWLRGSRVLLNNMFGGSCVIRC